jgi:Uma2 family endonuclease
VVTIVGTEQEALLERRRALGQDRYDEVWEGEYRMVPGPRFAHGYVVAQLGSALLGPARAAGLKGAVTANIGDRGDYRVPDQVYVRDVRDPLYLPSAEIVVEVLSPGDDTYRKFPFHAAHGVREIVVADPDTARVEIHVLDGEAYRRSDRSDLLGITAADVVAAIDWPELE